MSTTPKRQAAPSVATAASQAKTQAAKAQQSEATNPFASAQFMEEILRRMKEDQARKYGFGHTWI